VILAVDIDGTITDERRRLHPEVLRVLQSLEAEIILASGNTLCFTLAAATLIGTSGKVIAENGGVIQLGYDIEKILLASKDLPERALRYLSNLFPSIQPLDHEYRFSEVCIRRNIDFERASDILQREFPELELVDTGFAFHIKHRDVSKGRALEIILEKLESPAPVVAIGDSMNDVSMFEVADLSVALANAPEEAKKKADVVTEDSFYRGFLEALNYLDLTSTTM